MVPAGALAWVLWLCILHNLPTGTAGTSSLAIPVVGVLSAWIQLGEQPGALEAAGMGLIVAALAILTVREVRLGQTFDGSQSPGPVVQATSTAPTASAALASGDETKPS